MSDPVTEEERLRCDLTGAGAGPAENIVSTACPACSTRFAMLARYNAEGWHLRCTACGWAGTGELKAHKPKRQ